MESHFLRFAVQSFSHGLDGRLRTNGVNEFPSKEAAIQHAQRMALVTDGAIAFVQEASVFVGDRQRKLAVIGRFGSLPNDLVASLSKLE